MHFAEFLDTRICIHTTGNNAVIQQLFVWHGLCWFWLEDYRNLNCGDGFCMTGNTSKFDNITKTSIARKLTSFFFNIFLQLIILINQLFFYSLFLRFTASCFTNWFLSLCYWILLFNGRKLLLEYRLENTSCCYTVKAEFCKHMKKFSNKITYTTCICQVRLRHFLFRLLL